MLSLEAKGKFIIVQCDRMVEEKSIQILSKCCPKSIHYRIYSKSDNFQKMFKNVLSIGADPDIFLFIFVLLTSQFKYKLKKQRWYALDSNPGCRMELCTD